MVDCLGSCRAERATARCHRHCRQATRFSLFGVTQYPQCLVPVKSALRTPDRQVLASYSGRRHPEGQAGQGGRYPPIAPGPSDFPHPATGPSCLCARFDASLAAMPRLC